MSTRTPRIVVVTRPTAYEMVVARHASHGQAAFFLQTRGQSIEPLERTHMLQEAAVQRTTTTIPVSWRRARVGRENLDRFLFEDDDIIVAVGQDGLVANAAKYLNGQPVIGLNPDPESYEGILVPHPIAAIGDLFADVADDRLRLQSRTMVEAQVDGGFTLRALNEVFIGHRTHQSARYRVRYRGQVERHSSSGAIVASGTGSTGWARSIRRERRCDTCLPEPEAHELVFFVREAFPSPSTGCSLTDGLIDDFIEFTSEMNEGGVIFGDGIEADRIEFGWGRTVRIARSPTSLRLAVA